MMVKHSVSACTYHCITCVNHVCYSTTSMCVVDVRENEYLATQERYDLELEEIALEFDNDLYWKKRLDLENSRYKAAWTLRKCGDLAEVNAPIPEFRLPRSDFEVDEVSWFPLSVPSSVTDFDWTVFDEVWEHPLYPVVFRDALMEFSARLGGELAVSQYVGDYAYNRMLMDQYPAVAYFHRAQLDVKELRRTFLRDERVALASVFGLDDERKGIELVTRLPVEYEQMRAARLVRLRRDESVIRERYAGLAMAVGDGAGKGMDDTALQAWIRGNGH